MAFGLGNDKYPLPKSILEGDFKIRFLSVYALNINLYDSYGLTRHQICKGLLSVAAKQASFTASI